MFDKLKNWFSSDGNTNPPLPIPEPTAQPPKPRAKAPEKTAKELATEQDEPYIAILSMDVDPKDINSGVFEFDWNQKFIANLARAGYQGKTDADLVDQWFQNVCRNVVLETYEQYEAMDNDSRYMQSRDLGNGRREIG
jgi:hypothetical protein